MRQDADGTYIFTDRPVLLTLGALTFACSFGAAAWHRFVTIHTIDGALAGLALGVGAAVAGAFCIPFTRFSFDPGRKLITFTTRSVFDSAIRQLSFDTVKSVKIETNTTSNGSIVYRVALVTHDGEVPLGAEYSGSAVQAENLASQVRMILGLS